MQPSVTFSGCDDACLSAARTALAAAVNTTTTHARGPLTLALPPLGVAAQPIVTQVAIEQHMHFETITEDLFVEDGNTTKTVVRFADGGVGEQGLGAEGRRGGGEWLAALTVGLR